MLKYHIDIFYSEDDGGYIANIPDLEYCSAFGSTRQDALKEVLVARSFGSNQHKKTESRYLTQNINRYTTK